MTGTIDGFIEQVRAAAADGAPGAGVDRDRVRELAAQFESMLLVQMVRDMREAGRWTDESEEGGLGAGTYLATLDVELAQYLGQAQGIGLQGQLFDAFERAAGHPAPVARVTGAVAPEAVPPSPLTAGRPPAAVERAVGPGFQSSAAGLQFAVPPGTVTSEYGWRTDPITGHSAFHRGIDIRAAYGQDVQAAADGRVVVSGEQGGYGTTVVVEHREGVRTRYAHLSAAVVQAGDRVVAGQVLGHAGHSGRATGTHLHFEVTVNGRPVSPAEAGLVGWESGRR